MPRLSRQQIDQAMDEIEASHEQDPEILFQEMEDETNQLSMNLMDSYMNGWDDFDPFLEGPDPDPNFSQRFYDEPNDEF